MSLIIDTVQQHLLSPNNFYCPTLKCLTMYDSAIAIVKLWYNSETPVRILSQHLSQHSHAKKSQTMRHQRPKK